MDYKNIKELKQGDLVYFANFNINIACDYINDINTKLDITPYEIISIEKEEISFNGKKYLINFNHLNYPVTVVQEGMDCVLLGTSKKVVKYLIDASIISALNLIEKEEEV